MSLGVAVKRAVFQIPYGDLGVKLSRLLSSFDLNVVPYEISGAVKECWRLACLAQCARTQSAATGQEPGKVMAFSELYTRSGGCVAVDELSDLGISQKGLLHGAALHQFEGCCSEPGDLGNLGTQHWDGKFRACRGNEQCTFGDVVVCLPGRNLYLDLAQYTMVKPSCTMNG